VPEQEKVRSYLTNRCAAQDCPAMPSPRINVEGGS
jgi:hypothetical protein